MMQFWKEHTILRIVLMAVLFVCAAGLVLIGWKMTGRIAGLILMVAGVVLFLAALAVYNRPFAESKRDQKKAKQEADR